MNHNIQYTKIGARLCLLADGTTSVSLPSDQRIPLQTPIEDYNTFLPSPVNTEGNFVAPTTGFYEFNVAAEGIGANDFRVFLLDVSRNNEHCDRRTLPSPDTVEAKLIKTLYLNAGDIVSWAQYQFGQTEATSSPNPEAVFVEIEFKGE